MSFWWNRNMISLPSILLFIRQSGFWNAADMFNTNMNTEVWNPKAQCDSQFPVVNLLCSGAASTVLPFQHLAIHNNHLKKKWYGPRFSIVNHFCRAITKTKHRINWSIGWIKTSSLAQVAKVLITKTTQFVSYWARFIFLFYE